MKFFRFFLPHNIAGIGKGAVAQWGMHSDQKNWTSLPFLSVLTGFETANKYEIKNAMGQRVYFAAEENDCCTLNCCGTSRPFTMKILDNVGQEVIELRRPLRCSSCCCPCCLQEVNGFLFLESFGLSQFKTTKMWIFTWGAFSFL